MSTEILNIIVSSPQELRESLPGILGQEKTHNQFVSLNINGAGVAVRFFQVANVPVTQLGDFLRSEAVEILNLPGEDIELDFQVFDSTGEDIRGIYICLPQALLKEYFSVLKEFKCLPVKITAPFLSIIDALAVSRKFEEGRIGLLDLTVSGVINLAIFNRHWCEMVRVIPFDTAEEAKHEIILSLRSACAKSSVKKFDRLFILGYRENKDELAGLISSEFATTIEHVTQMEEIFSASAVPENSFISLNLARNFAFTLREQQRIVAAANIVVALGVLACLGGFIRIGLLDKSIQDVRASYTNVDLQFAKGLEKLLKTTQ